MIDIRYKPPFLPQMNLPYDLVLQKLGDENVSHNIVEIDANELNPLQGIVFSDEVANAEISDMNPIYIDNENNILDGHHRFLNALYSNILLKAVMINLNNRDACRILNKIQDIYEYEQSRGLEEVEMQDAINYYGDDENQTSNESHFLNSLEEDNTNIQIEKPSKNEQTIIAYRKEPIKNNSVVGNFFTLKPVEGYNKYEIQFDNLLDTHSLGITYKDGQEPVEILSKIWFPHVNFEELGKKYNTPALNIKNKAIAEKAMKLGFDGIKYGDTLIQGLK